MTDDGSSLDVLLIEDNPNDARLIRRHLTGSGTMLLPDDVTLHHEERLATGQERLENEEIDLLLLDLGLEKTSGVETFDWIEDSVAAVPVVVLTGLQDESAAIELLQQGAQDYLTKGSMTRDTLLRAVRYALERQQRESELRATKDQLEVLNRILRHDISNDIQVLQVYGNRLAEQADTEQKTDLHRILRTTERINELTENSREYMRIVAGDGELQTEPLELTQYLREEVQKARTRYPDAEFEVEDSLSTVTVEANAMLSSVFRNLLNNTVQHSDGSPAVEVGLQEEADHARVTIADDGPGVPDERKTDVFGRGERGLRSDGTGIGLYIVRTVTEECGGSVRIRDNEPTGAVVEVELTVADSWA